MPVPLIFSRNASGVNAPLVTVEAHITPGLPQFSIVGLPETAVKESKDRVRSAITNTGFEFPKARITVNLAPADLPKEGARFDLAIALAVLAASEQLPPDALHSYEFLGELSLSGSLRPVRGTVAAALAARTAQRSLIVSDASAHEAALVDAVAVLPATDLGVVCAHLFGQAPLAVARRAANVAQHWSGGDLAEIRAQSQGKRALEVAAAGGHNLLMAGPPGTGKTMLASCLPGLLPLMSEAEALETASVWSVSDQDLDLAHWRQRPYRAPHHTASTVALVGGGSRPRPGEISLAHNGVLFLDELPEFQRPVLEALRQPLENGRIVISRSAQRAEFPARIQLVTAMNPCPCGFLGDPSGRCECGPDGVRRYRRRLSGPLLDRIDIQIDIPRVGEDVLFENDSIGETSATVRERVLACRERQLARATKLNSNLTAAELRIAPLNEAAKRLLKNAIRRLHFSARAVHRVIKVARTIADLDQCEIIGTDHVAEALSYRQLAREIA
jgi:magnesium chelatase family protein